MIQILDRNVRRATSLAGTTVALALVTGALITVEAQEADPVDVESIDAIITAVYDVISGDAGEPRDWSRWNTLFLEEATLSPTGPTQDGRWGRAIIAPSDYPRRVGSTLERDGFVEAEVHRVTERFGNIAHVFSTYASFRNRADTEPFQRGINSFQLLYDGTRWWVVSIFWQAETTEYPIPEKYTGDIGDVK
ncbi:MAG: hypothetical protein OXU33_12965 [Gemmatimonadota bacterium]|nr:hypothetical protein [Gemmatimonadota bacterium]MDE3004755.1 hypothetical protein [Gemmatimonadota bacterium]MDE3014974.1 hypothetical protein [Gemmatimonadota bacterium]